MIGFCDHLSAQESMLDPISAIEQTRNDGKHTISVFMDIENAFDKANVYKNLIALQCMGINERHMRFLKSYPRGRMFAVKLGDTISYPQPLHTGVPQDSVLNPELFNVFLSLLLPLSSPRNPICVVGTICADDVCI